MTGRKLTLKMKGDTVTSYMKSNDTYTTMAALRGQLRALSNDRDLRRFVVQATPTGVHLGTGSYGSVEEVIVNGLLCAGKRIHEILLDAGNVGVREITTKYVQECQIMSNVRHPNVTLFIGVCFLPNCQLPLLVMERLEGSLDDLLETVPNIPLAMKRSFLEDTARGLLYLHKHDPQIIHRDLTAKNVLLTSSLVAKITDLGNSRIVNIQPGQLAQTLSRNPGTLVYMPPEALSVASRYGPSLDVFSFGHLGIFVGLQVFPGDLLEPTYTDQGSLLARSEVERRRNYIDQLNYQLPKNGQHPFVQLVTRCLQNEALQRPTAEELVTSLVEMKADIEGPYGEVAKADAVRQVVMMRALRKKDTEVREKSDEVDNMTSAVVSAALDVRKSPGNKEVRAKLDSMRETWASKVQELTGAIDDVIDPEDFVTISEANIQQDMARCRDAIQNGRWSELVGIVQGIAAKAHRIVEVGKATTETASDESYKTALSRAVQRLEGAIPKMLTLAKKVASNPSSQHTINDFIVSLRELLASIHDIQEELSRGIDVPEQDEEEVDLGMEDEEPDLSTTTSSMTAQERMMRKNLERLKSQPRYIGGLGKRVQSTPRTMESESQQSSPHKHGREDSVLSYSEGFSQSFGSGDAETQTPRHKTKDQFSQVEDHYLSTNATLGSPLPQSETLSPFSLSTASWTTPTPFSPLHMDTPSSSFVQASPARVLPSTPTEKAMKSYVSPLQHLVTAARKGDTSELPGHSSALSARAIRITEFARSAADTVKDDSELVKVLKVKSSEVNLLTPQMIEQAEEVARDPQQRQKLDDLEATSHKWAGHVKQLIDATQQANLPWSKTAENLQKAAMTDVGLQSQIDHVSTQTNRMVDIATMTMKAAETEEAIGFVDNSDSGDAELQEQVQRVKVTASDIQKLTPKLLGAAEKAVGNGESSAAMERLNLLSEEWATKAKVLMKRVDDVSLGMGGAADTLFISARSGDHGLLTEQTKSIQTLAESLQDIAQDSVERCTDAEKVKVVQVAAGNIVKLSTRLIECANTVAKDCKGDTGEPSQSNVENVELLRRDWAAQVHHLTAHIDDITAEMSSPLDHLVEVALQANQRSGLAKQHLMDQFESKASFLSDQLEAVCEMFSEVTDQVTVRDPTIEKVNAGLAFLKKLSPHAIGAARSLASEPGSAMLEHFNHLRRQWASKAQVVLASLQKITSTDVDRVIDAFDDLLHLSKRISVATSPVQKSYSNEDVSLLGERLTRANLSIAEPSTPKTVKPSPTLATDNEVVLRQHTVSPHHSERHASMTVPLPSWNGIESALDASSRSIAFAAQSLKDITDDFVEENNQIVDLAKKMAQQMSQMADYARGQGELQDKDDMIHTAKAIAANGQAIVRPMSCL